MKHLGVIIIFSVPWFSSAFICSETPIQTINHSMYVFTGKVVKKSESSIQVEVIKLYKGALNKEITVHSPKFAMVGDSNVTRLKLGESYLFSSSNGFEKKGLTIFGCDWRIQLSLAQEKIQFLEHLSETRDQK